MTAVSYPASPKQVAFIQRLVNEGRGTLPALDGLTSHDASILIDTLLKTPKTEAASLAVGMYRTEDGTIYKVQAAKQTGSLYAKRLVQIGGQRLTEGDDVVHFEFQYDRGAVFTLRADQRLTLEEAKAFGIRYGVCCVCGAFLKDAKSVAEGIGPVCAGRI